ncbi:STAS/SEC14 domain-containing protein [Polyangium mundeleinium]|uniref:STAS/SEC14 domain-containing protein n=1 Tax=Polyangium mundeleinium TaxID=2995306 RepID=A0ABT5EI64_9BACT|nr:STAS/SEC14 domain-containing protein [Polyangium mundeleinium]MDC0741526.1 STAS/SEC14 domain-containing protein [Polyangium mundeleinium]
MQTPSDGWDSLGPHPIRFEPPDLVLCRPTGVVTADDVRAGLAYLEKASKQVGHGVYYIADLTKLTNYAPSMAVQGFKSFQAGTLRASAMFGANLYQRAVFDMILRATRLLGLEIGRIPIESFPDEASARAWIDELRRKD